MNTNQKQKTRSRGWLRTCASLLLLGLGAAQADDTVELAPGLITGSVTLDHETVLRGTIWAFSTDGYSASANFSGPEYALTLAGGKTWRLSIQAVVQLENQATGTLQLNGRQATFAVAAGETRQVLIHLPTARVNGEIDLLGGTLNSASITASGSDSSYDYFATRTVSGANGNRSFSLPMVSLPSINVSGSGFASKSSGAAVNFPLLGKVLAFGPTGGSISWTIDLNANSGSVVGEIEISGPTLRHHIFMVTGPTFMSKPALANGSIALTDLPAGRYWPYLDSYFGEPYYWLRQEPRLIGMPNGFDLAQGQTVNLPYRSQLGHGSGSVSLGGLFGFDRLSSASIYARGIPGTATDGGFAQDLLRSGENMFHLALLPGQWTAYVIHASFFDGRDATRPLNANYYLEETFRLSGTGTEIATIAAGADTTVPGFHLATTGGTLIFDVLEGAGQPETLIASPHVSGWLRELNSNGQQTRYRSFSASGSSLAQAQPGVQIVAEPGIYDATAEAMVNGSRVVFARFPLELTMPLITPSGLDVQIAPLPNVTLTFAEVTQDGVTTVIQVPVGPKPPTGFKIQRDGEAGPALYYDITTSATFSDSVKICFSYNDGDFPPKHEANLKLFHYRDAAGTWEPLPTELNTADNIICGVTESFSVFAILVSASPEISELRIPPSPVLADTPVSVDVIFSDEDENDVHGVTFDWGDGSTSTGTLQAHEPGAFGISRTALGQHAYGASGNYNITVTITDAAGNSAHRSAPIEVNRQPMAVAGVDQTLSAGIDCAAEVRLDGRASHDPDGDNLTYRWQIGETVIGMESGLQTVLLMGVHQIVLTVEDSKGGSSSDSVTVSIFDKAPPLFECPGRVEQLVNAECAGVLPDFTSGLSGSVPECSVVRYSQIPPAGTIVQPGHHPVVITATDAAGNSASCETAYVVLRPVYSIAGMIGSDPTALGTAASVKVLLAGLAGNQAYTCTFDWHDETEATIVAVDALNGTGRAEHTYRVPGVYPVAVNVEGPCGSSASSVYQYVVVYDPAGGFVTGGGWIDSPLGAFKSRPDLAGKAHFGFVSKYQKGATIPVGETQFQFTLANLQFKSTRYEWLVVAGSKAQFKGLGEINGLGEYGFLLTATDGNATGGEGFDRFRIKIWQTDPVTGQEEVIYDNFAAAADLNSGTPDKLAQSIGGGSIVIHSPTSKR